MVIALHVFVRMVMKDHCVKLISTTVILFHVTMVVAALMASTGIGVSVQKALLDQTVESILMSVPLRHVLLEAPVLMV